jgi:putative acetyltransferase
MFMRLEHPEDEEAITQVTLAAFTRGSYNPNEYLIVKGLREAGALSLSLVAEENGEIVGHVAFSEVTINGKYLDWYGLGLISVEPAHQKQGIGSKLIQDGLARLRAIGAQGCVLEGSPTYYQRFGFKSYPNLIYEGSPAPEYFMALPFYETIPSGKVEYHQAFYVPPPNG